MFVALVLSAASAFAQNSPVVVEPELVRFGAQPWESLTVGDFTVTNNGSEPLDVVVQTAAFGDQFAALISSTCDLGQPTTLQPGESCVQDVRFRPSGGFGGIYVATMSVTAYDELGAQVFDTEVELTGAGYTAGDRVVDLAVNPVGSLDPELFDEDGVRFVRGGQVGIVQGETVLAGPIAFVTADAQDTVEVWLAPRAAGNAQYRLAAHGEDGAVLDASTVDWAYDFTDPTTAGHILVALEAVPQDTAYFSVTSKFVSSPDAVAKIPFGVSSIWLYPVTAP